LLKEIFKHKGKGFDLGQIALKVKEDLGALRTRRVVEAYIQRYHALPKRLPTEVSGARGI
jgi:hypothetical protein